MKIIDIDKTIENLLQKYANHCARVLVAEKKRIDKTKYKTKTDRDIDMQFYNRAVVSYNFLLDVVKNPKKYLYTEDDIIYTCLPNGKSVYQMLEGVINQKFDNGTSMLCRLSEIISRRVHYYKNPNKPWIYATNTNADADVEKILGYNKLMSLIDANGLVQTLKGVLPNSRFAVSEYPNER